MGQGDKGEAVGSNIHTHIYIYIFILGRRVSREGRDCEVLVMEAMNIILVVLQPVQSSVSSGQCYAQQLI